MVCLHQYCVMFVYWNLFYNAEHVSWHVLLYAVCCLLSWSKELKRVALPPWLDSRGGRIVEYVTHSFSWGAIIVWHDLQFVLSVFLNMDHNYRSRIAQIGQHSSLKLVAWCPFWSCVLIVWLLARCFPGFFPPSFYCAIRVFSARTK